MEGMTSSGLGSLVRPALNKAASVAKADKVKAIKVKAKVSIKKKLKPGKVEDDE
jgi:hypothetical protein